MVRKKIWILVKSNRLIVIIYLNDVLLLVKQFNDGIGPSHVLYGEAGIPRRSLALDKGRDLEWKEGPIIYVGITLNWASSIFLNHFHFYFYKKT